MIPERLRSIFWKEFIQMRRDRATFGMMLAVPAFQLMLFGYAVNMDVRNLPAVVLAAIVLVAVKGLVDVTELRRTWRRSRRECAIAAVAFAGVLLLGIL